jgi:hypothetical protein
LTSSSREARVTLVNGIVIDRNRSLNQPPRTRAAMPMRRIVAGSREAVNAFGLVPGKRFGLRLGAHGKHARDGWRMFLIANETPPAASRRCTKTPASTSVCAFRDGASPSPNILKANKISSCVAALARWHGFCDLIGEKGAKRNKR